MIETNVSFPNTKLRECNGCGNNKARFYLKGWDQLFTTPIRIDGAWICLKCLTLLHKNTEGIRIESRKSYKTD